MHVRIEFDAGNAAFGDPEELDRVLGSCAEKIREQLRRLPASVCDAPEEADKLRDCNGNTVGSVKIEWEPLLCEDCGEPNLPTARQCDYCLGELY